MTLEEDDLPKLITHVCLNEYDSDCMHCAGPSAVLAALVASGIACDTFQFVGFLHAKQGQRQKQLKRLAGGCLDPLH